MSVCASFAGSGGNGIASALRAVDCQSGAATSYAFEQLFGANGHLLPALTLLLTLYIALFAIGLLTGRSRLGVGTLTPRMMTLGLVLTFATSWAAYQNVVWTLATGAPDQIAGMVTGSRGSATIAFADRLDRLFAAVSDAADQAARPAAATEAGITPPTPMVGGFTAATVLALSSAMLLLGTVGVLVTAKIVLAALMALGPVFIVLALFRGTRGLFEGWLKGVVLFAAIPLLAVLIGGGAVVALEPVARELAMDGAQPSTRGVGILFVGATVYLALMAMAIKTASTLVGGWRLPGSSDLQGAAGNGYATPGTAQLTTLSPATVISSADQSRSDHRVSRMVAALPSPADATGSNASGRRSFGRQGAQIIPIGGGSSVVAKADGRAHGIGNRFRARPTALRKERIS